MSTHEKNIIKETIRTLAVIAKGNARDNESREQRKHARAFFKTLGKEYTFRILSSMNRRPFANWNAGTTPKTR